MQCSRKRIYGTQQHKKIKSHISGCDVGGIFHGQKLPYAGVRMPSLVPFWIRHWEWLWHGLGLNLKSLLRPDKGSDYWDDHVCVSVLLVCLSVRVQINFFKVYARSSPFLGSGMKKGDLKQCANYRTIALVSHASKILLRIILERIRVKTKTGIADEQARFRQERRTRDQITNLRILMHKAREHQRPLCIRGTSHGPVSFTSRSSTKTAKHRK